MAQPTSDPNEQLPSTTVEEAMVHQELIPDELLDESSYDNPSGEVTKTSSKGDVSIQDPEGQRHVARANATLDE